MKKLKNTTVNRQLTDYESYEQVTFETVGFKVPININLNRNHGIIKILQR